MSRNDLDEFLERVRGHQRREELAEATAEALDAFKSAGVSSLLLKGPVLAQRIYAETETRSYWDIDLMVPPRQLDVARAALGELGYIKALEPLGIDDVAAIQHGEVWARAAREGGPLCIDLHWGLDRCKAPGDVVWEALAHGSGTIEIGGKTAAVPGDAGLALHLAIHAAQHGPADVKALGDLSRGIQRLPREAWRSAAQVADDVDGAPAFAAGLRLLPEGEKLAEELELAAAPALEWEIRHREERPRGTFHLEAMANARGVRERLNVLRRSLFPTPQWIRLRYSFAARNRLFLLLAYARHLLRAPLWALRAARYRHRVRRAGSRD